MEKENIVIGIEGYVGTGKTSVCKQLLNEIPNSVLIHGGNIYRAIVYGILKSGVIDFEKEKEKLKNIDVKSIMDKLRLEVKIENRESVIYINKEKIDDEKLQSLKTSMATSKISNIANNRELYKFGKEIIEDAKSKYNVILSSRDIVNMYPKVNYHFLLIGDIDERVNRKYEQYKGILSKEELKEHILKRDELQRKSGYYKIHEKTIVIDVTEYKTIKEEKEALLKYIKILSSV